MLWGKPIFSPSITMNQSIFQFFLMLFMWKSYPITWMNLWNSTQCCSYATGFCAETKCITETRACYYLISKRAIFRVSNLRTMSMSRITWKINIFCYLLLKEKAIQMYSHPECILNSTMAWIHKLNTLFRFPYRWGYTYNVIC